MAVPKVISATNFTDESNPTVTFTNKSGRKISMAIMIVVSSSETMSLEYTDPAYYSSPYTFDLSMSMDIIRQEFPNKSKLTVQIGVVDSGTNEFYYVTRTMTFVNAKPEFTTISGYDADSSVVNVTGDNSILLMGKSNLAIDWTPAVGKKYATIKSYTVEWQDQSKTYTASASHPVSDFVLASSGTSILRITATDSRGFTTTVEKELDVIKYVPPIAVVEYGRVNNYEDETKLKIDASYTSVMVDDVEKNSITCRYRFKQNLETAEWSEWTEVANNKEITLTFPKENEYLIQYTATDAFGEIWQGEYQLNKGKFPMFIDTELNAVGINDFPKTGEALRVAEGLSVFEDGVMIGDQLVADYIIEEGTSGYFRYEKWVSGKAVAYMPEFYEYSNLKMSASGNLYISEERYANLPSGLFVDTKYIVSHEFQSASGAVTILRQSTSTKDQYHFKIYKVFSTATGVAVKFRVEGRWK